MPLMKKLGYPALFCNSLIVGEDGMIEDFKMRISDSKLSTVKALQSIGFDTIASGDSYNDLAMIKASKAGFLFKSTEKIIADNPAGSDEKAAGPVKRGRRIRSSMTKVKKDLREEKTGSQIPKRS
jgi:bifunctional phosphoserine phosphatase/homoserine phosphotransferase